MIRFMAIKVHYDHRQSLPTELKYSKAASKNEYGGYLRLHKKGIGGEGFHECLNYFIPENGPVRMYLPPTCIPSEEMLNDEFVIFSLTYGTDQEMPSRIIGVHGNARLLNRKGLARPEPNEIKLIYHAEADPDFVTLFFPSPLQYNPADGLYTPRYQRWGHRLRYIEKPHAKRIISDQLRSLRNELASNIDESRRSVLERESVVLHNVNDRYFSGADTGLAQAKTKLVERTSHSTGIPDKELGDLGEKHVYERELRIASKLGQPASQVKWVSRGNPQSPFDIMSIRKLGGAPRDHYIEVKSTTIFDDTHIFVSAREIEFLDRHREQCSVVLVRFNADRTVKDVRYFTIGELRQRYELVPVSFKLHPLA